MPPSATMKAVVLHGADDMHVEAWPRPVPGQGEVLLKVEVASICGTDVKVLHRTLQGQPAGEFTQLCSARSDSNRKPSIFPRLTSFVALGVECGPPITTSR